MGGDSLIIFLHVKYHNTLHNCKSGQHNQRLTFRRCKLQHKTSSVNIPYTDLKIKGRNRGRTKFPSPCRHNIMICAFNLCQDATLCGFTKMKLPFLLFDEPNLCNNCILRDPEYIGRFVVFFYSTVFSIKLIQKPILQIN